VASNCGMVGLALERVGPRRIGLRRALSIMAPADARAKSRSADTIAHLSITAMVDRRTGEAQHARTSAPQVNGRKHPMPRTIFVSLPVSDLSTSITFYKALGFVPNPQLSDETGACMVWSEAICVMLISHARWRTLTQRPFPPPGTSASMLSLAMDSREAVDAMNDAAAAHGGQADVNPMEDLGFMVSRDIADPDGHLWGMVWMDAAATASAARD